MATTDSTGHYHFANLPPGAYTLTVSAQNFATYKQDGIDLAAGTLFDRRQVRQHVLARPALVRARELQLLVGERVEDPVQLLVAQLPKVEDIQRAQGRIALRTLDVSTPSTTTLVPKTRNGVVVTRGSVSAPGWNTAA